MWKRWILYSLFSTVLIAAAAPAPAPPPKPCTVEELGKMLPEKIAVIDGKTIGKQEFLKYFMTQMPYGRIPQGLHKERAPYALAAQAEQMVTARLLEQYLREKKVHGSPAMVEAYYRKQLAALSPDERNLLELRLKYQKKTVESWIAEQSKNIQNIREIAAFDFFEKEYTQKIAVPDSEIRKYYDSNTSRFQIPEAVDVSQILIPFHPKKPREKEAAAKRAAELAAAVKKNPGSFAALAIKNSKCPSAKDGGRLGMIGRNMMHKNLETAAFALAPGAVSGVLETPNGYHILRLNERRPARRLTFDEVKAPITEMLKRQEALKRMEQLVAELKAKHKAEVFVKMPAFREIPMEIPADAKQ